MNSIRCPLPDNLLDDFDRDLQLFYNKVLNKELKLSDPANALKVKKALKEVVHAYKKETVESLTSNILFDSLEKRYSYILKHCPCFTSAAARHFHRLLLSNPHVVHDAVHHRGQLNVCCLGGGPATDAVAVAKIVDAFNNSFMHRYRSKLLFKVSVVDLSQDWMTTADKVLQTVQQTPEFCDEERMLINFEFLKADLTEKWTEPVRNAIRNADILTMVYFVSAVNGTTSKNKCCSMLQNIMHTLKPGAVLFFLDSSKDIHYKTILSATLSFENVKQIYGPYLQKFHTLSMKSIKKFLELYSEQFNVTMCLTNCFISCGAWTKERPALTSALSVRGAFRNDFYNSPVGKLKIAIPFMNKGRNSVRKKIAYNNKKREHFGQKIENLFLRQLQMDFDIQDLEEFEDNSETENGITGVKIKILYPTKLKCKRIFI